MLLCILLHTIGFWDSLKQLVLQSTMDSLLTTAQFSSDGISSSKPRRYPALHQRHPPCLVCFRATCSYLWHRPHPVTLQLCLLMILMHWPAGSWEPSLPLYLDSKHVVQCLAQWRCPSNVCEGKKKGVFGYLYHSWPWALLYTEQALNRHC